MIWEVSEIRNVFPLLSLRLLHASSSQINPHYRLFVVDNEGPSMSSNYGASRKLVLPKQANGDSFLPIQVGKIEVPPLAAYLVYSSMYLCHRSPIDKLVR